MRVEPSFLDFDSSGAPVSRRFGDVYRSRQGALAESHEVFVQGARIRERWAGRRDFTILEIGFGLGLNLLAVSQALLADSQSPQQIHFLSLEAFPLTSADLVRAHEALGLGKEPLLQEIARDWPFGLPGLHRLTLAQGRIVLILGIGRAENLLPKLDLRADAVFLDGFSPAKNPDAWDAGLMKKIARRLVRGATLATYSAATRVRDALVLAGFEVERVRGFGPKRERINARYLPRWRTWPEPAPAPNWPERSAIIVGGGIAGCTVARTLAISGWKITLFEAAPGPMTHGSSQPLLAQHPHISPDDNFTARLTRAALLMSRTAALWSQPRGRLVLAQTNEDELLQNQMLSTLGFPAWFAKAVDSREASDLAGIALKRGAIWMPRCSVVRPHDLARAMLVNEEPAITVHYGRRVGNIVAAGTGWIVKDIDGNILAEAPVVVICSATYPAFLDAALLPALRRTRGQTTWVRHPSLDTLKVVLGGSAYAAPGSGGVLVGATYDEGEGLEANPSNDHSNVQRLARTLGWDEDHLSSNTTSGSVGFRYSPVDRLPLIGELPDSTRARECFDELLKNDNHALPRREGLFTVSGLGSRGLLWSVLGAQLITARLQGSPMPIEADLIRAVDPARHVRNALRFEQLKR